MNSFSEHDDTTSPRISIIVATWNASKTIERCLHSVIEQNFSDWELLIADGGSDDGTVELLRKYQSHIFWWQSKRDKGIYDAWNQALVHARGEYVCFLGADDALADINVLSRICNAIGTQTYDLVSSRGLIFDPRNNKKSIFGGPWNYKRLGRRMVMCHPGLLHRRTLFQRYGQFDARYRIAGDLDFLLRLPVSTRTMHLDIVSVLIEAMGISRSSVLPRLREQREALVRSDRHGVVRAYLAWLDKLWRYPIARLFNIPH
ncbi:glycosyltransferase [Rhodanobacter sp. FDAARGOS 1247]|uniref:glycosyltransferase family 2 protein n=1 Tax=Rhodanobacter sp. FDAARGOS 1247 TaxID=2778082 RepID=UPI00194EA471|nr:glycosyltransferase family 2 protein [Rhodanobacter sp. FDAARGOS 1247]QRP64721.1 glycosyltransferase [Rhodanobacter sp. FDAARGOS 1247]